MLWTFHHCIRTGSGTCIVKMAYGKGSVSLWLAGCMGLAFNGFLFLKI